MEFYLPKIELHLTIILEKHTFIASEFDKKIVEKFLPGTKRVESKQLHYRIKDIKLQSCYIKDENRHFIFKTMDKAEIFLNDEMVITGININEEFQKCNYEFKKITNIKQKKLFYNKFFIKKNFKTVYDTIYKFVRTDSIVYKKPKIIKRQKEKNENDVVYDLVHYLVKTRKRKFRLISGLDTIRYNPDVFAAKLKNLDSLENALFNVLNGYTQVTLKSINFDLINFTSKTDTLAYFSEKKGFTQTKTGTPLIVQFEYKKLNNNDNDFETKGLPYIIPQKTKVKILLGDTLLYENVILVPQLGQVKYMQGKFDKVLYGKEGNIKFVSFSK